MLSPKMFLPMLREPSRTYAVTLTEQRDLACRFGLTADQVRSELEALAGRFAAGELEPQKSATKTKSIIQAHFEKQQCHRASGRVS